MQNIRFTLINYSAAAFFSFACAYTAMETVHYAFAPEKKIVSSRPAPKSPDFQSKPAVSVDNIVNSGVFILARTVESGGSAEGAAVNEALSNLILLGTITGDRSIARAMIKKRSDNSTDIFKTGQNAFGYTLVRVDNYKVYLKSGKETFILDMFAKEQAPAAGPAAASTGPNTIKSTLSKGELQQKIANNMDNMLKGMRAGPNRVGDVIDGFKIFIVPPDNILYQLGVRNGDIIKRINGHPIDSMEKLYNLWQQFPKESKVVVDIQRGEQVVTYDFTMTN
jgi:type II secretion system protein C